MYNTDQGDDMARSKHDEILKYIQGLPEGSKISVRQVSSYLGVSEGTSYRAIKSAEKEGIVKTIERVGTLRVVKKEDHLEGEMTFKQVNHVIQGSVLAGSSYLEQEISRFIIGAMRTEEIETYMEKSALLIVGNREEAQLTALNSGAGILITGGFGTERSILNLAEELKLPVISTSYDTFSVASIIQRELYSLSVASSVQTARDLMLKQDEYSYDIYSEKSRYVASDKMTILVDGDNYLGTVKSSDLNAVDASNYPNFTLIDINVMPDSTLQRIRQVMSWHQLNVAPVVDNDKKFLGIVHRRDVFKQIAAPKLQASMSTEEIIDREITILENKIHIKVMPFMTDEFGAMTQSGYMRLVERVVMAVLNNYNINSYHIDTVNIMNLKLVQLGQEIILEGKVIDMGDQFIRLEIEVTSDNTSYSKVMMLIQYYKK